MERRDFLKISVLTGAVTALESCGSPDTQLIRFLPEEDLVPGVATWKPSVCTLCPAGCGLIVRVMEGQAEVVRNGKTGIIKMGLAKKLEGNPQHPVNRGKLCARGHAGLQVLYHPDRLRGPDEAGGRAQLGAVRANQLGRCAEGIHRASFRIAFIGRRRIAGVFCRARCAGSGAYWWSAS